MDESEMRILFVSRWYPFPPDNGARSRVYHLLKQLSQRHEITLLSFCQEPVGRERTRKMERYCCSVQTIPYRAFHPTSLRALLGYLSLRPRSLVDTFNREMQGLVEREALSGDYDIAVASTIESVPYVLALKGIPQVFEEIELAVPREQFLDETSPVRKLRAGLMWWKLARFVRKSLCEMDGCTVVSEQERELVAGIAPRSTDIVVVPNGVDLEANAGAFGDPVPDTLIYSGALTYGANMDAMDFFLEDILPLVKEQRSGVKLRITGRYDSVPVDRRPTDAGVELTGYLDDIRPAVARSWVCVVPLRVGGGTRLKILEAMALGTPVVSTSKGAEGLDVEHGRNILIADGPQEFACRVLDLLRDAQLRKNLAMNGRQLVEDRYSWKQCTHYLEELLYRVRGAYG